MMGLALGRSKATGRSGNMKIPSLVIWWLSTSSPTPFSSLLLEEPTNKPTEGRTLGTENMPKIVSGSAF